MHSQHRHNQTTRQRAAGKALPALILAVASAPGILLGGSSPTGELFMPQGSGAPVASGDYLGSTGGLNIFYRYFIEAPAGGSRLVVDLFDPDIGTGGAATEAAANRDRDRGDGFSSVAQYRLYNPAGTLVATSSSTTLSSFDNAWATLYDTNDTTPTISGVVTNTGSGVNNVTVNVPAGLAAGDLLIGVIHVLGQADVTTPTGWTPMDEGNCAGTNCRMEVFRRTAVGGDTSVNFAWTGNQRAVGAVFLIKGANTTPTIAVGTGSSATPTAPTLNTTSTNNRILRLMASDDNNFTGTPYPASHTGQYAVGVGGPGTDIGGAAADRSQAAVGATGTAAFAMDASINWRAATIAVAPSGSGSNYAAGHWELQVDQSSAIGGGDDLNALGIRAHDGTAGAGGTEVPVYYDTHTQIGTNDTAGAPSTRNYDLYPWVTAGCTFRESDFDFDVGNGTGGGPAGAEFGRIELVRPNSTTLNPPTFPSPSVFHQALASSDLSADNSWNTDVINTWTTDSDSVHYGIWRADAQISEYSGPNSNYANVWFSNFESAGGAPTTNPTANAFRVYLPTDGGGAPAKPYLEQFARWLSGPNPPDNGSTTRMAITVRLVNPTAQSITFSTPNNVVTAPLSGSTKIAYVGSSAGATSGSIVSQPANNATTGSVVWNPGTVAGGTVQILSFEVNVTPTVNNERILILQAPDISPSLAGTRAQYVDETGNTSQSRATYLFGPICEVAVTENAPTRAIVTGLSTESTRDGVVVAWTTATEDGTVGYRLYREQEGEWVAVGDLVRADPRAVGGASYRVLDPGADPAALNRYGLVEIDRLGRSRVLGPFDSQAESATADAPEQGQEVRAAAPPAAELERLQRAAARAAEAAPLETARIRPVATGSGAPLKVRVRESGLYALTSSAVAAASGMAESSVRIAFRSNQVRLEQGGAPIAALAASDGSALYFYGEARDSIYGLDNIYWVRFAAGVKMGKVALAPWAIGGDSPTASLERVRVEQELFEATVLPIAPDEDYWFWDVLSAGVPGADTGTYPVSLPAAYSGGADGSVEVRLRGASETGVTGEHQVDVRFGDTLLGTVAFDGLAEGVASFPLPAALLDRGAPQIELFSRLEGGVPYSDAFVDGFDVTYSRRHEASADRLELTADTSTVNGVGFTAADVTVFDVTDRRQPKLVSGPFGRGGLSGFAVGFRAQPGHRYLLTRLAAARTPLGLEADVASDLHGATGAQYVAIAPPGLVAAAGQLAALRAGQGLSTLVVSLADIDDEFGFGLSSPENLRAFLAWAYSHWSVPPVYVALVGEGTYDYRDLTGLGGNLIPALMVNAGDGLYASDSRYGDVDGDGLPEMAVGRIPVLTPAELATYVDRLTQVENASADALWRRNAILASDDADPGAVDFTEQSEAAGERLPASFDRLTVHLAELDDVTAHGQLLADLQAGGSVFLFHGHGGLDRLADESMLAVADVGAIQNQGREPFFAALTCAINRFEIPGYPALGEEMTRASDGAAIAVWAPSGISLGSEAVLLGEHLADSVFRAPVGRLGDAVLEAERRFADSGGSTEMLQLYHLLGDPALRLVAPVIEAPGGGGSPSVE